ncbi:MAG: metallophosphoesterase family protein [Thermodesulfobacteriota bacterium]
MKILILSDIHANWYALEAILDKESYDALVFLGDVVDFGPSPGNCIKFLMKSSKGHFWGVRGDHDHAMAYGINSKCPGELNTISDITREWGEGFLSSEEVGFLRRLPMKNEFSIDSMNFELVHGPEHGSDLAPGQICECQAERLNNDQREEESELNFILAGHSHKPFIKSAGNTIIINPGSVGQPRDLNPRASYAVIDNGNAYIKRVSYDIERTVNDLERSDLPRPLTNKLSSMLHSGSILN